MSLNQVLDQAEIDALLGGGDDDFVEEEQDSNLPKTFDFSHDFYY